MLLRESKLALSACAFYRGEWQANVWNERPVVRHLLGLLAEARTLLEASMKARP